MSRFRPERVDAAWGDRSAVTSEVQVAIVGGGIAGIAAAVVLAERGVKVTLFESAPFLGGRAGAWTEHLPDGTPFQMERGFHAFFRQYYNLRALLRRVDPALSQLTKTHDYPLLGPEGRRESFADLPHTVPLNILALIRRTPSLTARDLLHVSPRAATELLRYDAGRTYDRFDLASARDYLDSLRFPEEARRMLFEVFAHSFFNPEEGMSAAELLMQFHFYFTGNPEGLVFDVTRDAFSTAWWIPMERHLRGLGVDVRLGTRVTAIAKRGARWEVPCDKTVSSFDAVVLATHVPGLKALVAQSTSLDHPRFVEEIASLDVTLPFVVWRLFFDRPSAEGRAPFVGTAGLGLLDNISLFHLFEEESRGWARRTGGSVVELHAYGVPEHLEEPEIRHGLRAALDALYPEYRGANVLFDRYLVSRDCPAFAPGSHPKRPRVTTPIDGVFLAGDFVKLDFPTALMERACASGFLAANRILSAHGVRGEPLWSVPRRGLLASWDLRQSAAADLSGR